MKNKLLAALLLLPTIATAEPKWIPKPVLCAPTQMMLTDLLAQDYVPLAKSDIVKDGIDGPVLGKVLYMLKDQELFIIENFDASKISCMVGLYKGFTLLKPNNEPTF